MNTRARTVNRAAACSFVERKEAVPNDERAVVTMVRILSNKESPALQGGRVVREYAVHDLAKHIILP